MTRTLSAILVGLLAGFVCNLALDLWTDLAPLTREVAAVLIAGAAAGAAVAALRRRGPRLDG